MLQRRYSSKHQVVCSVARLKAGVYWGQTVKGAPKLQNFLSSTLRRGACSGVASERAEANGLPQTFAKKEKVKVREILLIE